MSVSYADVRDSIAVARSHGEKFFEQIVWQIENEAWLILGYGSWDEMREAEYADMGVVAPRADRPELVSRLRAKGLTQKQIADTVGTSVGTVNGDLKFSSEIETPATVINSRGQERPASYQRHAPEPERIDLDDGPDVGPPGPPPAGHGFASSCRGSSRQGSHPGSTPAASALMSASASGCRSGSHPDRPRMENLSIRLQLPPDARRRRRGEPRPRRRGGATSDTRADRSTRTRPARSGPRPHCARSLDAVLVRQEPAERPGPRVAVQR